MKIRFDNVVWSANNGPNGFAKKLANSFINSGHEVVKFDQDVQLSFISMANKFRRTVLRLDGIFFNSEQDWGGMNTLIEKSYEVAEKVVFQSLFDKELVFKFFGERQDTFVIHNGTDINAIEDINVFDNKKADRFDHIWFCASDWRPHKRLDENIRYYLENSGENDSLLIAGDNPHSTYTKQEMQENNVFYVGVLDWVQLISIMKRAKYFLHLAFLDHCPNVVVDAQACDCHVVCSSSGGTSEIVYNGTVVNDIDWDFEPISLYDPPNLDFSKRKFINNTNYKDFDIRVCGKKYLETFE